MTDNYFISVEQEGELDEKWMDKTAKGRSQ